MLTMPFMSGGEDTGPAIRLKSGDAFRNALISLCDAANITSVSFSETQTGSGVTGFDEKNILRGSVSDNAITLANARHLPIFANAHSANLFNGFTNVQTIDASRITWTEAVNCARLFRGCANLTSEPPDLPKAEDLYDAFFGCRHIPKIPNARAAVNVARTYANCREITEANIASGVNLYGCLAECSNLRSVVFPENVTMLYAALRKCHSINTPVYIPASAANVYCLLESINHELDVYIANANLNLFGILFGKNNSYRSNIHVPSKSCTAYNSAAYSVTNGVNWAQGDGFVYNATRNIYLYADYVPA